MTREIVIHVLRHGRALCGFMPGVVPRSWPEHHKWVGLSDIDEATCDSCVASGRALLARR